MSFNLGPFEGLLPVKVGLSAPSRAMLDSRLNAHAKLTTYTSLSDLAADFEFITLAIPELLGLDLLGLYRGSEDRIISAARRGVTGYEMLFPATPLFAGLTIDNKKLELNYKLLALPKCQETTEFLQWLPTVAITTDLDSAGSPGAIFDRVKLLVTMVPNVTVNGNYSQCRVARHNLSPAMLLNMPEIYDDRSLRIPVWYAGVNRSHIRRGITTSIQFSANFNPTLVTLNSPNATAAVPVQFSQLAFVDPIANALLKKSNDPYDVKSVDGLRAPVAVTVPNGGLVNE